jgi:trans-aconitate methyltransferase
LLELLDPKPGEVILDLGCGDGALTEKVAAAGCKIYGIDASAAQLQAAKQRGLMVALMNGEQVSFKRCFDAVFSNAAIHWMKQADRVVKGVSDCLKPGGRFVGEFGGNGNVETIRTALHKALHRRGIDPWEVDPWYYPSPEEYATLLISFCFRVDYAELLPRPTKLPGDIFAWLEVFAQPFRNAVAPSEQQKLLNEVRSEIEPTLRDTSGTWTADYVRLRFKATKRQN